MLLFFPTATMKKSSRFTSPAYNLLPDEIAQTIPRLNGTSEDPDPIIRVKWFMPDGGFTWYVVEFDPETRVCYGFVIGPFPEWGTFFFDEIQQVRGALGLPVERDLHFDPCPSSKITKDHY